MRFLLESLLLSNLGSMRMQFGFGFLQMAICFLEETLHVLSVRKALRRQGLAALNRWSEILLDQFWKEYDPKSEDFLEFRDTHPKLQQLFGRSLCTFQMGMGFLSFLILLLFLEVDFEVLMRVIFVARMSRFQLLP